MNGDNKKIVVDFEPISRRILHSDHKNFYQMLLDSGIRIRSLCGGSGTCGKCRVLLQKGSEYLNSFTESEKKLISTDELGKGWRLACQIGIDRNLLKKLVTLEPPQFRVYLPEEMLAEDFKILTTGIEKEIPLNPSVRKISIQVPKPSLKSPIPDFERLLSQIPHKAKSSNKSKTMQIEYDALKILPETLREKDHLITLTILNENEIIDCEPGDQTEINFGIAFDIGTTTIVGYLINLNNGKIYSIASSLNPQTAYGEDVISRITYIRDNEKGLQILNSAILDALNKIILKTCNEAKINPLHIYEVTIVGNSVMHHLFLGINPSYIGLSPYVPAIQRGLNLKPKDLNLNISRAGNVYILPLIAGFVGADTVGVILSSEIDKQTELTLAIDVGTNGEIIIGNREFLVTGSCAAGSALEGAHIRDGMRAAAGAIEQLKINTKDLNVSYKTINDKKPIGICGSGLIDAVAEMLKSKIITRSGSFNKDYLGHERLIRKEKTTEFIIAFEDETSNRKMITISQHDIREIQMAKAAFYSGTRLILNFLNQQIKTPLKIDQIFLAGAFGNYIDKNNAKFIGMIPDIPSKKIYQIGNAAGTGAQHCLLDKNLRKKAENMIPKIQYVEIAIQEKFQKEFAEAMYFPHLKLDQFSSLKAYQDIPKR